ncbi:MAG: hypothetical protein PVG65_03500, partial [Candidatus Thorarchaeota archaeon]
MKKPVTISVSLIPNLLQHTIVGLEIGNFHQSINPKYSNEYKTWFSPSKRELFSDRFKQLEGISSSTWFLLLYQIPAYLSDDNIESLIEIIGLLSSNDPFDVIHRFPRKEELIEKYIPREEFHRYIGFQGSPPKSWQSILEDYSNAIQQTYDDCYATNWKQIQPTLNEIAVNIKRNYFEDFDWISWWESQTQLDFPYPKFQIELTDPATPLGTSLLAERDGFYAHTNPIALISMISHEIGTHIFFNTQAMKNDLVGPLIREDMESYLRGLEVISWATNRKVIEQRGIKWVLQKAFE